MHRPLSGCAGCLNPGFFNTLDYASAGLAFAAAQPSLLLGAQEFPSAQGVPFELLGVDFVVDARLQPWLLEVNAVPSMARQVCQL